MSESSLTRRQLLAGSAAVGATGALAGGGVRSLLNDAEAFDLGLDGGALGLDVAWESRVTRADGETSVERYPDSGETFPSQFAKTFDGAIPISISNLQDGDEGTVTIAGRSCDNPGVVWARLLASTGDDPSVTGDLAEAIDATASVGRCGEGDGRVVAEGSLLDVLETLGDGILLVSETGTLGKVEYDDESGTFSIDDDSTGEIVEQADDHVVFELDADGTTTRIRLDDFEYKDGDGIVEFDFEVLSGLGIAGVTDKGGPDTERYRYPCVQSGENLRPPINPGGDRASLSYVSFQYCDDLCVECEPPVCLTLDWELDLPEDHGVEDGEELALTADLLAQQCRHNPTPENPWS